MCVVKVTNLALQSELFLRAWCYRAEIAVSYCSIYLIICHYVELLFLPGLHALHATQRFEMVFIFIYHCQTEANIKNRLPRNCSLFISVCPSKIQLGKLATSSNRGYLRSIIW